MRVVEWTFSFCCCDLRVVARIGMTIRPILRIIFTQFIPFFFFWGVRPRACVDKSIP
jgi:hypothetical protein